MIKVKTTNTHPDTDTMIVWYVYHQPHVDSHVNPHGVLVQNGEGTTDASQVGWYTVAQEQRPDGHVLSTENGKVRFDSYEEAAKHVEDLYRIAP